MHPLISAPELAELLGRDDPPVVLDVRWRLQGPHGRQSYTESHLPEAVFLDVDTDLAGEQEMAGRHPLPSPASLQETMRAAGVRTGHPVVAYDDSDGSIAARAWWLLRWAGHAEVAVLDGGYAGWVAAGYPVTTDVPEPDYGTIDVHAGGLPTVDADEVALLARSATVLDARVPARYAGEVEPVDPRAGHIPGARNAPFTEHHGQHKRWRTGSELAQHFQSLGVAPDKPVIAYCGSGVTACSVILALELAGHPAPAALYPGSWSQWSSEPDRPVATGQDAG